MTALDRYERLESEALWRPAPDAQRRNVLLQFGDATLVISDSAGRPLAHWSLPALVRQNPSERPAIFSPDDDASETLEISDDIMVAAIEQVRKSLAKAAPQQGRLRFWLWGGLLAVTLALAVFWLPGALKRQTLAVVPPSKRADIGAAMLLYMQGDTGRRCITPRATQAAENLARRLFGPQSLTRIVVVPELAQGVLPLPGGLLVLDYRTLQTADDPAVAAGHLLRGHAARQARDPLAAVLNSAGLRNTFQLLTTGDITIEGLQAAARDQIAAAPASVDTQALRALFTAAKIPAEPYAEATGTDLAPDPLDGQDIPQILSDSDWVSLQNICNT